jgi:hypothetical protein
MIPGFGISFQKLPPEKLGIFTGYSVFHCYEVQEQQLANQFLKCSGLIKLRATAIILSIISAVVGANLRKKDLSCYHQSSMGLK